MLDLNFCSQDTVRKEIATMSALRHPTLINLHDAFEDQNEMVMIYELWVVQIAIFW